MKYSTFILVGVCVIIFLLQISIQGFTDNFVLKKELLFNEPWRLLTSIFLHSGIPHLLLNMFSLALFGIILENIIVTRRFLLIFFISGLIASLFSGFFYNSALGASGAIFGIIGNLIILRPKLMIWVYGVPMPMFLAGIVYLIVNLFGVFLQIGNTGYIAHLFGLVIGLLFGFLYYNKFKEKKIKNKMYDGLIEKELDEWERKNKMR